MLCLKYICMLTYRYSSELALETLAHAYQDACGMLADFHSIYHHQLSVSGASWLVGSLGTLEYLAIGMGHTLKKHNMHSGGQNGTQMLSAQALIWSSMQRAAAGWLMRRRSWRAASAKRWRSSSGGRSSRCVCKRLIAFSKACGSAQLQCRQQIVQDTLQ